MNAFNTVYAGNGVRAVRLPAIARQWHELNDLPALFGLYYDFEVPLRATPCFTTYLKERRGSDLTWFDNEVLRFKLMRAGRGDYNKTPDEFVFSEKYTKHFGFLWAQEWKAGVGAASGKEGLLRRNQHVRALLR